MPALNRINNLTDTMKSVNRFSNILKLWEGSMAVSPTIQKQTFLSLYVSTGLTEQTGRVLIKHFIILMISHWYVGKGYIQKTQINFSIVNGSH